MIWVYGGAMVANAVIGVLAWRDGYRAVGVINVAFIAMNGLHAVQLP